MDFEFLILILLVLNYVQKANVAATIFIQPFC